MPPPEKRAARPAKKAAARKAAARRAAVARRLAVAEGAISPKARTQPRKVSGGKDGAKNAIVVKDVGIKFAINRRRRIGVKNLLIEGRTATTGAGEYWPFRHISFSVAKGESVGIVGRNGC